ncbi:unnamed protein product, partial [Mesorhabditis spiculigera]
MKCMILILVAVALFNIVSGRKCSFNKDGEKAKEVDCGDSCDFCRFVQIKDDLKDKSFKAQGCGCGADKSLKVTAVDTFGINSLGDCATTSLIKGTREAGGKTPIEIHIECCKKNECA